MSDELLRRTTHGVEIFYNKHALTMTMSLPHQPCDECRTDVRELRAWLDSRGLLKENMN